MYLTVFGATGGTGKEVVKQALAAGHHVTAFARTPANVPDNNHPNLHIVQGDVRDAQAVAQAITAQTEAVISVLGHRPGNQQDDLLLQSIQHIIAVMKTHNVNRLVALSGAGAWISDKDQPGLLEHAIRFLLKTFSGHVLSDSLAMAHYIMQTDLDWTIPRGPRIVNGEHTGT
ncbi:MAG: NAD(P)-dependent oxidoreductase [Anaerolineae bacterium]